VSSRRASGFWGRRTTMTRTAATLPANLIHCPLWIVTMPTSVSELADICFSCTVPKLRDQFLGGLDSDQIVGVYANEATAKRLAVSLLESRNQSLGLIREAQGR
jgi:hypothetical protein